MICGRWEVELETIGRWGGLGMSCWAGRQVRVHAEWGVDEYLPADWALAKYT
jgi:hypothetical protein